MTDDSATLDVAGDTPAVEGTATPQPAQETTHRLMAFLANARSRGAIGHAETPDPPPAPTSNGAPAVAPDHRRDAAPGPREAAPETRPVAEIDTHAVAAVGLPTGASPRAQPDPVRVPPPTLRHDVDAPAPTPALAHPADTSPLDDALGDETVGHTRSPKPAARAATGPTAPLSASPPTGTGRPGSPHLGAMLIERQLVTPDQLRQAMERHKRTRRRLGRVLVEMGFTTPEAVLDTLSAQLGVPSTRVNSYTVNPDAVRSLSEKVARKHMAFPLLHVGSTLVVAIASPKDLGALDDLRFASGCSIQMMVAMETEIQAALDKYYGSTFLSTTDTEETGNVVIDVPGPQLDLHDETTQRSAVSLVDRIIAKAASDRASDIHLEPSKSALRVRFRIDGTFREVAQLLLALAPAVIARIKVLSGMDIAEHRLPQDGRFSATIGGRGLDMRSSTYPTIWGEKAVLRLLDRTSLQLSLDALMPSPTLEQFRELICRPEGILLVTGPTGSGKTSTLYAALAEIAEKGKNIMTLEDPVEFWLPGINQGQTNHKSGFTFARGMRAILRQDPDVIMVGEIRDSETMETAIEASLTGHLVLSTLHTNSAVATVARLVEMGLEPYLLASAVAGILAQRLVRKICDRCRESIPTPRALGRLFRDDTPPQVYRGAGCDDCHGTGFLGRQGIYELLVMTDELRGLMHDRVSEVELTEMATRLGLTTLRDACLTRAADGTTTVEEVIRVTMAGRNEEEDTDNTEFPVPSPPTGSGRSEAEPR